MDKPAVWPVPIAIILIVAVGRLVPSGTAHVVAWADDGQFGPDSAVADRRHWHSSCWDARTRRRPR